MHTYRDAPRLSLGFFPTPLVSLKRLSAHLGGPAIYMKRDDCTGLATGGNKTRKLEFLLADALSQNADTLITCGALQSNHARQTAAAAAAKGLDCVLILGKQVAREDALYQTNGNVLLNTILGATVHIVDAKADLALEMAKVAEELQAQGKKPYSIPMGGSNIIGAMGYAAAVDELYAQCKTSHINATHLVIATGSGGTQAGLIRGLEQNSWNLELIGFSVGPTREMALKHIQNSNPASNESAITVDDSYVGTGYGQPTKEALDAIQLVARTEGILLDPVYTGKAMAGLIGYIQKGRLTSKDSVIFLHSGGTIALSAYEKEFSS